MKSNFASIRAAALLLAVVSSTAAAQRGNASDVTGPIITGSTIAGGTYASGRAGIPASPAVTAAVTAAGQNVEISGRSGTLTDPVTGAVIPAAASQAVIALMTTATAEARAEVQSALSQSGASGDLVNELLSDLPNLLSNPTRRQLEDAVRAFNALVNHANAGFLTSPPPEFLAIHAVLLQLVQAGNQAAK